MVLILEAQYELAEREAASEGRKEARRFSLAASSAPTRRGRSMLDVVLLRGV